MCSNKVLFISAFLIYFISCTDGSDFKLIPNGSKTVHKDGAKHEITNFIVVPKNQKDHTDFNKGQVYHSETDNYENHGGDHIASANDDKKSERSYHTYRHSTPKKTITKYRVTYKTTGVKHKHDDDNEALVKDVDGNEVKDDTHTIYQPKHINLKLNNVGRVEKYGKMTHHTASKESHGSVIHHQIHSYSSKSVGVSPKTSETQYKTSLFGGNSLDMTKNEDNLEKSDQVVDASNIITHIDNEDELNEDTVKLHKVELSKNEGLNIDHNGESTMGTYHWSYKYPKVITSVGHVSSDVGDYSRETDEDDKYNDINGIHVHKINSDSSIASEKIANSEHEAHLKHWESKHKPVDSTTITGTDYYNDDILAELVNHTTVTSLSSDDEIMERTKESSESTESPVLGVDSDPLLRINSKKYIDHESELITSAQSDILDTPDMKEESESTSAEIPVTDVNFSPYSSLSGDEWLMHGSNMKINTHVPVPGNIEIISYHVEEPLNPAVVSYSENGSDGYLAGHSHKIESNLNENNVEVSNSESINTIKFRGGASGSDNNEVPSLENYPIQSLFMSNPNYEIDDSNIAHKIAISTDKSSLYSIQPDWYQNLGDNAEDFQQINSIPGTSSNNDNSEVNSELSYYDFSVNHSANDNIQDETKHLNIYEATRFPASAKISYAMPQELTLGGHDNWDVDKTKIYPRIKSNYLEVVPISPEKLSKETAYSIDKDHEEKMNIYSDVMKLTNINNGNSYLEQTDQLKHHKHGMIPNYKYHIGRTDLTDLDYIEDIRNIINDKDTVAYTNLNADTANLNMYRNKNTYIPIASKNIEYHLIKESTLENPTGYVPLEKSVLDGTYVIPVKYLHSSPLLKKYPWLAKIIHSSQGNGYNNYGSNLLNDQQHNQKDKIYKYVITKKISDSTHGQHSDLYKKDDINKAQRDYLLQNLYNVNNYQSLRPKIVEIPVIPKDEAIKHVNIIPYYSGKIITNSAVTDKYITDPFNNVSDRVEVKPGYNVHIGNDGLTTKDIDAIERKYNLTELKRLLHQLLNAGADTNENLTLLYNNILNHIVYLHRNRVNDNSIKVVIRDIQYQLYTILIKAETYRNTKPYNYVTAGKPCCYSKT